MEVTVKKFKRSSSDQLLKKLLNPKLTAIEKAAVRQILKERKVELPKIKKVGVIQMIFNSIDEAPISMEGILKVLVKKFPDKNPKSMMNTIKAQIGTSKRPTRMERERKVTFVIEMKDNIKFFSLKK